ncbi:MAG: hypothetical protein SF029_13200 [bacterium]|nr:hypothetical protein [bacterium]
MRLRLIETPYRDLIYATLAAVTVAFYVSASGGGFPLDDSWIHQVYARNLAQYGEWSFVPGEPSGASTSPLYTVLLAVGYILRIPYPFWTHVLGALALGVTAVIASRLGDRLTTKNSIGAFLSGLVILATWHLLWAAAAGMETMLAAMWSLVLIWLAWREADPERDHQNSRVVAVRGLVFGVCAALSMVTRPEGVLLAGLCGLMLLIVRPQGTWRSVFVWSISAVGGFAVAIAPYLLLNFTLTGGPLPSTSDAKYAQVRSILADTTYWRRLSAMVNPLLIGGQTLLIPGALILLSGILSRLRGQRSVAFGLLLLLWPLALIALYAARLPAPIQHGRYVIPALPAFLVAGVIGLAWVTVRFQEVVVVRVLVRTLAASAILVFLYFGCILGRTAYRQDVQFINTELVASAQWIGENLPSQDLLAVHDIGAVGYFAPRPLLDIAGLVSPEIVPIYDSEAVWDVLRERNARYLMAFAFQIPGTQTDDPRLCLLFQPGGESPEATAQVAAGTKMRVYEINWEGRCPE